MRRIASAGIGVIVLITAACGGNQVSDELRRDLDLASSDGLQLASSTIPGTQIVSAIEQTPLSRPAVAPPQRTSAPAPAPVPKAAAAERATPEPEPAPEPAPEAVAAPEPAPVTAVASTTPVEEAGAPSARPRPMEPRFPAGGGNGGVQDVGTKGPVIVVIRGGTTGRDPCPPRAGTSRPTGGVAVNNRIPPVRFPTGGPTPRW